MQPRFVLIGMLLALLAGCVSQQADDRPSAQGCDSARLSHLVGQVPNETLLDKARKQANAERVRVIAPGMAVTLEYDARRLTLYTDEQGRIKLISCG